MASGVQQASRMKISPAHEIVLAPSAGKLGREQLLQQCYDIRIDVFRREMRSSLEDEADKLVIFLFRSLPQTTHRLVQRVTVLIFPLFHSLDDTSEHFLLRLMPSLLPIGTVRVSRTSSGGVPCYTLSRFAILKDYRQHGFQVGRELVQTLHEWVIADSQSRGEQIATVLCHSLVTLKSFYGR